MVNGNSSQDPLYLLANAPAEIFNTFTTNLSKALIDTFGQKKVEPTEQVSVDSVTGAPRTFTGIFERGPALGAFRHGSSSEDTKADRDTMAGFGNVLPYKESKSEVKYSQKDIPSMAGFSDVASKPDVKVTAPSYNKVGLAIF